VRYLALATDFDGTLAEDGKVSAVTLRALKKLRESGRRLLLVTGRELPDLRELMPDLTVFDLVVAENGAVVYDPSQQDEEPIANPARDDFVAVLKKKKVSPLSVGQSVVATFKPNETKVLATIQEMALDLQIVFNKDAVMVLPPGVNKASGLNNALSKLGLSRHNVAGIGDAENDFAFLELCEVSAAVANSIPTLKDAVDYVTKGERGAGVRELVRRLLKDDLHSIDRDILRHRLVLATHPEGDAVTVPVYGTNMLFTGSSGGGKSTLAKITLERLVDLGYQFCVVDPEGDYEEFEAGVVLGDGEHVPTSSEVLQLLRDPTQNAIVNLLGVPMDQRPEVFTVLLKDLQDMRSRTGRPHWLFVDESHHVLPRDNAVAAQNLPQHLNNTVFITYQANLMLKEALEYVEYAFAVGEHPAESLKNFTDTIKARGAGRLKLEPGEGIMWHRGQKPVRIILGSTRFQHRRHRRKYAEGTVPPEEMFHFRGPDARLNLMAQNLAVFTQMAQGIDDETWLYHLKRHDYSNWFREVIKDPELADEVKPIEGKRKVSADGSKKLILEAILRRYTVSVPEQTDERTQSA
jgi:phosphoglycolate phosphatase (TIGR01487 family)